MLFLSFKFQNVGEELDKKSVSGSKEFQTVSVEMPDGEKLIVDVHYGETTEITVKLSNGRIIAKEEVSNGSKMSEEEIERIVKDLIRTLKLDQKFQAMNRIIFIGEKKNVSSEESTKAANEFRKCLDDGKNPEECVMELKYKYEWITDVNFTDLILLYKNW
jgi:hypothetical protein